MNDLELADLYDKSADVLEDKGWCRGTLWDPAGHVCARGAMLSALTEGQPRPVWLDDIWPNEYTKYLTADNRLAQFLKVPDVADWNNTVAKDKFEVIDAFRHAAKELRNDAAR
jgi:hypothetical protein